ncbi:peptidase S8/S53 domain-containing protein [Podospora didyma]|uniref:Peptidase S8/S53 domain-containing protein n=1 Tax=Podospora didyma TaxID=330526 RepID=A0AAE0P638_9PEZI|nr:peptidase S8/S53 domain-containing protein [Podospora didyma]
MAFSAVARALCLAVAFASTLSQGHPTSPKLVHERRDVVHGDWVKGARADAKTPLTLRIGLKQRNLERAEEFMNAVSHPRSETYGKFWSAQQVVDMFAPSDDAIAETKAWLLSEGVTADRISHSAGRNWIKVSSTVGEAETLLDAVYSVYENEDGAVLVACESYSLPTNVRGFVDLVTPTIQLEEREAVTRRSVVEKRDSFPPGFKKLPPWAHHPKPGADSLKNCSEVTTPACLRALYDIPPKGSAVKGNSYGIVEFAPQSYNQEDLNGFFSVYTNGNKVPNNTAPIFNGIDGGYLSPEGGSGVRGESNLDLCYAMALTYPQNVTLYQVGDSVAWNPATNNNFLDAIDGSYCSFQGGDDPVWDAVYPHDASTPGAYTGQPQCGVYNATKVISVSYGSNEGARPASYRARECAEYLKLGLMGVTVMFSSGDTGVAGLRGQCVKPDGSYTPVAADYGQFNPMFPGSCPWVTSVGGSALPAGGRVNDREVASYNFPTGGGFSNLFNLPSYQNSAVKSYYAHHNPGYNASVYNNTQKARGFPDVALNSQNYVTGIDGGFQLFSGTSASSPTFGAMITLINGERLKIGKGPVGFINPVLYAHPEVFTDITEGHNSGCGTQGFAAVKGWDPVTGLGAPNYEKLKKVFLALP